MTTPLTRNIERLVLYKDGSGRDRTLVIGLTPEGVYIKHPKQRWSGALLCPWGVAYTRAAWLAAESKKRKKREEREAKKKGK